MSNQDQDVVTAVVRRRRDAGQALVIMVFAIILFIGMTGLIVDGGGLLAHQRSIQTGTDAAAEAGALILAKKLAGASAPQNWDTAVNQAITASATASDIIVDAAYYTDICGIPLTTAGSSSLYPDGASNEGVYRFDYQTARVGSGALPTATNTTPDCPNRQVGPYAGVIVLGHRDVPTYFSGVFGIRTLTASTQSTAVAGFIQESCAAEEDKVCGMVPVAIPVNMTWCDGSGNAIDTPTGEPMDGYPKPWEADGTTVYVVPMCKNGPGNVGWIDWYPPGGGTPDIVNSILHPDNPAIPLPSWQYVDETGNTNSGDVEDALRTLDGKTVLVPQFDLTCDVPPAQQNQQEHAPDDINEPALFGCSGELGGNGTKQWYRIPSFAHFRMCDQYTPACVAMAASAGVLTEDVHGAYISGTSPICELMSGNKGSSCLMGTFETIIRTGTVGAGVGGDTGNVKAVGIQLIK